MIKLYHGSNLVIDEIDLNMGQRDKDFGKGFYLTDIKEQAEQMSIRRARITGEGTPCVTTFIFDNSCLTDNSLNVLSFDDPCSDWALFVLANRESSITGFTHNYDIVVGPVADDGVAFQLERYTRKMIDLDTLVKELTYRKLNRQYFFGTDKSISKLKKI